MKHILIVGANSAIASACARIWATEGAAFYLVGRDASKLQQTAADLKSRGAQRVEQYTLDMNVVDEHEAMLTACFDAFKHVDTALIAHGTLPDQKACEADVALTLNEISSNGLSVIALLTRLANRFEAQKQGTIAVISSVAGDRGRQSNYVYGAAKAAVTTFCEGLRMRLFKVGVHVLTIKPGFVDTPMTQGLPLPQALVVSPDRVAKDITQAVRCHKDTIYTPWFWLGIMTVIKSVPEFFFKRSSL